MRDNKYSHIAADANQFETVSQTETTQAFVSMINQTNKLDNDIQRMTSLNTTSKNQREIKHTKCITKYINLIRAKL